MDVLTPEQRSRNMRAIKSCNTAPELIVRRVLHSMGFRYRLHRRDLPGKPDLVLPRHRVVIFVHGCFWHRHQCKNGRVIPASRTDFWTNKFARNVERDRKVIKTLRQSGWRVLIVWECQTKDLKRLRERLRKFLK